MLREIQVNVDCADPDSLAEFWCAVLGYRQRGAAGPYRSIEDPSGRLPRLVFQQVPEPKVGKARLHLDLYVDDVDAEVARLESLGARRLGERFDLGDERWQVMADPEGNELCLCWHPYGD